MNATQEAAHIVDRATDYQFVTSAIFKFASFLMCYLARRARPTTFQATETSRDDIPRLVADLNDLLVEPLSLGQLDLVFDVSWPRSNRSSESHWLKRTGFGAVLISWLKGCGDRRLLSWHVHRSARSGPSLGCFLTFPVVTSPRRRTSRHMQV